MVAFDKIKEIFLNLIFFVYICRLNVRATAREHALTHATIISPKAEIGGNKTVFSHCAEF